MVSTTTWRRRVGCRRDTKGRWETEDRDLRLVSLLFFYLPVDQFARCTVWRRKREHIYIYLILYIHISVYAIIIFCRVCSFDRAVLAIHKWDKIEYSGDEAMNFESCRKQRYPPGKRYRSVNVGRISCPVTYASACMVTVTYPLCYSHVLACMKSRVTCLVMDCLSSGECCRVSGHGREVMGCSVRRSSSGQHSHGTDLQVTLQHAHQLLLFNVQAPHFRSQSRVGTF